VVKMKYKAVFWDIDGTMYDNSGGIPENERDVLSFDRPLSKVPKGLKYWVPYHRLADLMRQIPKDRQGVISNGYDQLQRDKLRLLGLDAYINPNLIFTSYGEAEKILNNPDHPLLSCAGSDPEYYMHNLTQKTQKPELYMFQRALDETGFSAEECVMIGDGWQDLVGARNAGMQTIYIGTTKHLPWDERKTLLKVLRNSRFKPDYKIKKGDIEALTRLLI